jgi:hypothetical protein
MALEMRPLTLRRAESGRMARQIEREDAAQTLIDIRRQAGRVRYAVVADRMDVAMHAAGNIVSLAEARLRRMTDPDDWGDVA